jgi:integrase
MLLSTGMRRGEAVGLRWADVDLDAGVASVRRSLTVVDGTTLVSEPKTAKARRQVALDVATVEALARWRTRQKAERLQLGGDWVDTGYVFTKEDGNFLHPDNVMVVFRRLVTSAGVPAIRLHDLRHTSATLALAAGVHPKVVQERLGHSSIGITLDTYSHVVQGMQADAAALVGRLLVGGE